MTHSVLDQRKFADLFNRDGSRAARLCSEVILHLNDAALIEPDGLLAFHDQALTLVGDRIRFIQNGDGTRWKSRPKDLSGLLRGWFARGGPAKGSHVLYCESGETAGEPSDAGVFFSWVLGDGYIRLVLPAEAAITAPDRFAALASALAARVDFRWGSAGLSLNQQEGYSGSQECSGLARIGSRLPGVDLGEPLFWSTLTKKAAGIKSVNWLTFLGRDLLAKVVAAHGSHDAFIAALGSEATVSILSSGIMIQAGAAPSFGDTERGEKLLAYEQVARALHALKIPPDVLRNFDEIGGTENTRKWLNRFD